MRYFEEIIKDQNKALKKAVKTIEALGKERDSFKKERIALKEEIKFLETLVRDPELAQIVNLLIEMPDVKKFILELIRTKRTKKAA